MRPAARLELGLGRGVGSGKLADFVEKCLDDVVFKDGSDLIAMCVNREQAKAVQAELAEWLRARGLTFNTDKTQIVGISEGHEFPGFHIRRNRNDKLLIKPSKAAVKRIRTRLAAEVKALYGATPKR